MSQQKISSKTSVNNNGGSVVNAGKTSSTDTIFDPKVIGKSSSEKNTKPNLQEGTSGDFSSPGRAGVIKVNNSSDFNQDSKEGEVTAAGLHNFSISNSSIGLQREAEEGEIKFLNYYISDGNAGENIRYREMLGENLEGLVPNPKNMFYGMSFELTANQYPDPDDATKMITEVVLDERFPTPNGCRHSTVMVNVKHLEDGASRVEENLRQNPIYSNQL